MKVTINLKPFAISMASFAIAYSIVTEKIDQYITFAGEANAFGCFVLASTPIAPPMRLCTDFDRLRGAE